MPELPEVEIASRQLRAWAKGRRIVSAKAERSRVIRGQSPQRFAQLAGHRLEEVERSGKWMLLRLDGGEGLLSHLGMTGKWIRRSRDAAPPSHVRASGVNVIATCRSRSCCSSCSMNLSTISSITAADSGRNVTMASSRLRNSGLKTRSMAARERPSDARRTRSSCASPALSANPIVCALNSRDPAFDVRIRTTLRKSALRPVLSVRAA